MVGFECLRWFGRVLASSSVSCWASVGFGLWFIVAHWLVVCVAVSGLAVSLLFRACLFWCGCFVSFVCCWCCYFYIVLFKL